MTTRRSFLRLLGLAPVAGAALALGVSPRPAPPTAETGTAGADMWLRVGDGPPVWYMLTERIAK